jgi:putative ABC transport system permease protein
MTPESPDQRTRMTETVRRFIARFRETFRRGRIANELRDELAAHLEMEIEHNIARGMTADEARRVALIAFGGVDRFREEANDARGFIALEQVARDVRYAARRLRRTPTFTLGVVVTLGVGLGGAVGLGMLAQTVLLRPLPYADPDRIVRIDVETPGLGTTTSESSPGIYQLFVERAHSIALLGAYYENDGITIQGQGVPERTTAAMVTPSVFGILGTRPAIGRLPNEVESAATFDDTIPVVVSYAIWQRHFGGDSAAIGRTIELNRAPRRVVGVLPRGFDFPSPDVGVWFPTTEKATNAGLSNRYLTVIGRLSNGASVGQANAEVATILSGIAERYPELSGDAVHESGLRASARTLRSAIVAPVRGDIILLAAVAALVLVIAFTNVTTLVLLRAESIRGEIALSQALGASAGAVVQRLVVEGLVLALGGLVVALPIATAILSTKLGFAADQVPRLHEVHLDAAALIAASIAAIGVGVALGGSAALRTRHALADGGLVCQASRATGSIAWRRWRQLLVAGQVAMALAVLLGSGLMAKSLRNLHRVDLGFVARDGATFSTPLPFSGYDKYQKTVAFHLRVVDALRKLPGVTGATAVMRPPLTSVSTGLADRLEASSSTRTSRATATSSVVTPGYFAVMGIPLRGGRTFERGDYVAQTPSVIISRSLAKELFSDRDPLGQEIRIAGSRSLPAYRVVGVVGDVYSNRIADGPVRSLYFPFVDDLPPSSPEKPRIPYNPSARYVVRTSAPLSVLMPEFRRIITSIDPRLPITDVITLDDMVAAAMARARIATTLLAAAALAALLLGAIGLYSVIAFTVAGRTREFAVRIAVGATTRSIIDLVFCEGLAILAVGIVSGMALSIAGMRVIQSVLYDVSVRDAGTYAVALSLVLVTAVIAIYLPARRAAATDPARILRSS